MRVLASLLLVGSVLGIVRFWQPVVNYWNAFQIAAEPGTSVIDVNDTTGWQVALHKETEFVTRIALEKYLKARLDSSFFSLDLTEALAILESHPWIKVASARKVWPNTFLIETEEHQPWLNLNNEQLVSNEGVIFKPDNIAEFAALPLLEGEYGKVDDLLDMYGFFSKQMPSNAFRIAKMKFSDGSGWSLKLENNIELFLGKKDLTERLERFFSIADKIMAEHSRKRLSTNSTGNSTSDLAANSSVSSSVSSATNSTTLVAYVDLRYQTGIAVGWHEVSDSELVAQR